jgi:hypothetical protein
MYVHVASAEEVVQAVAGYYPRGYGAVRYLLYALDLDNAPGKYKVPRLRAEYALAVAYLYSGYVVP